MKIIDSAWPKVAEQLLEDDPSPEALAAAKRIFCVGLQFGAMLTRHMAENARADRAPDMLTTFLEQLDDELREYFDEDQTAVELPMPTTRSDH